jgi:betaine reductase
MTQVAVMVGSPRVIPGMRIVNPLGNVELELEKEKTLRREIVVSALEALKAPVKAPTLFAKTKGI